MGTFIGTAVSCLLTAWALLELTGITSVQEALLFGALISATDPVATLAVFKQVFGLEDKEFLEAPLLYDLVFGESVLNDAVAIVLFHNFRNMDFDSSQGIDTHAVLRIIGNFFLVATGSTLVGVGTGLFMSLIFKYSTIRSNAKFDLTLIVFGAYLSFYFSSMVSFSGLFSIFFYGIVCGHYM